VIDAPEPVRKGIAFDPAPGNMCTALLPSRLDSYAAAVGPIFAVYLHAYSIPNFKLGGIMKYISSIKYITYAIVSAFMFFGGADKRGSQDVANDISTDGFAMHQEYNPDSINYYYEPEM
jgi:hypothetical protein